MDHTFYPGWFYAFWINGAIALLPLGLAKISILLQYLHLFKTKPWMKTCILGGIAVMAVFYFSFTLILIIFISPWPNESLIQCITSWHVGYFAKFTPPLGVINILFDFYVLILPIPAILALQLSTSKKIGVLLIFLTGGLACIASIISTVIRFNMNPRDITVTIGYVFLWG